MTVLTKSAAGSARAASRAARPVVLLTGAGHGIGRATAEALAVRGYPLALLDRDREAVADVAAQIEANQGTVAYRSADVRDSRALRAGVESLEQRLGPVGVLVACAGVGGLSTAANLDLDGFQQMLEINVLGVARTIEAVLPGMFAARAGHIVGISSVAGYRGMPWMPGYSASKAALTTYLEALRPALKRRGVSISTVYPGFVRTAITRDTPFRKPVPMLEPAQAAQAVVRAVERRPRDLAFPLSTAIGMEVLRRMPNWLYDRMMDHAGPRALTTEF